jgi:hypothetical protein
MDIGTFIAVVVTTLATVAIAIFAIPTIQAYRKQVEIGQGQVRVSQEQQYNQFRPILYPGGLGDIVDISNGPPHIKMGYQNQVIEGLRNVGVGPAFNIYGIIFGRPYQTNPPVPPNERYVVWNYPALSPGEQGEKITLQQFTNIKSDTTIAGFSLYVPDDIDHIGIIARFTITYQDVFNRKHASIYDYQGQYGWICRGHFNIESDIRELDQQTPGTKQANLFWMNAAKTAQS